MLIYRMGCFFLSLQFAIGPAAFAESSLTPTVQKSIEIEFFDAVARESSIVQSPADFDRYIVWRLKPEDRRFAMQSARQLKRMPIVRRQGSALVFDFGFRKFNLVWKNLSRMEFSINGADWQVSRSKPLSLQAQEIVQKLTHRRSASNLFDIFYPNAEAQGWDPLSIALMSAAVGAASATVVGVAIKAPVDKFWCWTGWGPEKTCLDEKKAQDEALFKDAPALDAESKDNVFRNYEASKDWACPPKGAGKDHIYMGRIRRKNPPSDWFNVMAKIVDGRATDMVITTKNGDPVRELNHPTNNLVVHVSFDPSNDLPQSYRIPNPSYNPKKDLIKDPDLFLTQAMKLTPGQKTLIKNTKDMISVINYKISNCFVRKVSSETPPPTSSGQEPPPDEGGTAVH